MASRTALFILLNILFFTMVTSTCPPPPKPSCPPSPKTPKPPKTPHPSPPKSPPGGSPPGGSPPGGTPPGGSPNPPSMDKCPIDTLKLGVCANLLNDLVHLVVGSPPNSECCTLISGLADLQAAICLCTAIKANVLGINLNVPISLSLLLNNCGKKVPSGFKCE